jgi:LCP family protein required for cell wall assembly
VGRHRLFLLAVAAVGASLGVGLLGILWREADRAGASREEPTAAALANQPRRAVTVLVVGIDADRIADTDNGAAPKGLANADALLLVRVNPKGPLQVLNLPTELAVMVPGQSQPRRLGELYRMGGVALTADVLRELLGLSPPAPDRFVVLPRESLRKVVDDLGGLEVNPPRTMQYQDRSQKLKIDLQSGLQRLDGREVEHMARFRDQWLGNSGRREHQQLLIAGLRQRMGQPEQLERLPSLIEAWQDKVETNLSPREALSLLAVGLGEDLPIQFGTLPLEPISKTHGGLRQLSQDAPASLWKAP